MITALLAAIIVFGKAWYQFKAGVVVAHVTQNTWTYQLRAYRELPFDPWFSKYQCEIARRGKVFYMAPLPAGDSSYYKETDCKVSLADKGALFRVADTTYVFEWKPDYGALWFRDKGNR